jgi:hypothetical protein
MADRTTETSSGQEFLLRLDSDGHYFVAADGREVGATNVLSCARHFSSYIEADRMCQFYRRKSFRMAVVTDAVGTPITHQALHSGPVISRSGR